MTLIALIDYGAGNLRSVEKALQTTRADVLVTADPADLAGADKLVLPGVGAFGDGMAGLRARGLIEPLLRAAAGKPLLGICLGMQLLFERSDEMGDHPGLGLLPGRALRFPTGALKVPQTGWNQLEFAASPLFDGLQPGCYVYFNHSYYCAPAQPADVLASTTYGFAYASVVGRGRLYGVQFHPEKSQDVGLRILRNFVEAG
jgi:glutamine amidotransferase